MGAVPRQIKCEKLGQKSRLLRSISVRLGLALACTGILLPLASPPIANAQSPRKRLTALPENIENTLILQLALARRGFSPGSIDGVMGSNTRRALQAFQQQAGLPTSGQADPQTCQRLTLENPPFRQHVVTAAELGQLRPLATSWLGKSEQDRLDYETIQELAAEKSQSSPTLIGRLNPAVDWTRVTSGTTLVVPNASSPPKQEKAAFLQINLTERTLQAFDDQTNLLAHFPCSIGLQATQRPVGELEVSVIVPAPNYTFNPRVFPESAEGRRLGRKLILPPGPNNPVGTVWLGLNRTGYGIHGTPKPERIGRAESHGCFRLTNWNAEFLLRLVWISMPVRIINGGASESR